MTSRQLEEDYRILMHWWSKFNHATYANTQGPRRHSEANNQKIQEISNRFYEIKKLIEEAFVEPIGIAVMEDLRSGRRKKKA